MTDFEKLLAESEENNIEVEEKSFRSDAKGLCKGSKIAISKALETSAEKSCILAEELGHCYTTVGDILDQKKPENRKQELKARLWAYNKLIGLMGLIRAYLHGCRNTFETAEYLGVTEEFLSDAIQAYKSRYGTYATVDNYIIYFEPCIGVMEIVS